MAGEICCQVDVHHVTKSFPSPGVSFLQPPPHGPDVSRIAPDGPFKNYTRNEHSPSKHLKDIHMSGRLMEDFVNAARENTEKDLETCGVLGAFLKDETYYVTTLIIPKQETTSNSCQAINEEEIYAIQNEESLLPIGWIHTHPSQSCFMSSIDVHTQYTYQVMVPEAVGIVLAPTDESRSSLSSNLPTSIITEVMRLSFFPLNLSELLLYDSENTEYSGYLTLME